SCSVTYVPFYFESRRPPPFPTRRSSDLVNRTINYAMAQRGNIVLLHDAGGDRSQTVEALPMIIDELRARGFRFVTVSELLGLSRSEEHTSELQSRENLVCRLLLEKKKRS